MPQRVLAGSGRCRRCGCMDRHGCPGRAINGGDHVCDKANDRKTLCTACAARPWRRKMRHSRLWYTKPATWSHRGICCRRRFRIQDRLQQRREEQRLLDELLILAPLLEQAVGAS